MPFGAPPQAESSGSKHKQMKDAPRHRGEGRHGGEEQGREGRNRVVMGKRVGESRLDKGQYWPHLPVDLSHFPTSVPQPRFARIYSWSTSK